jgi:hypothetical protein
MQNKLNAMLKTLMNQVIAIETPPVLITSVYLILEGIKIGENFCLPESEKTASGAEQRAHSLRCKGGTGEPEEAHELSLCNLSVGNAVPLLPRPPAMAANTTRSLLFSAHTYKRGRKTHPIQ